MQTEQRDRRTLEQRTLDFLRSPEGRRQEMQARRLYEALRSQPAYGKRSRAKQDER